MIMIGLPNDLHYVFWLFERKMTTLDCDLIEANVNIVTYQKTNDLSVQNAKMSLLCVWNWNLIHIDLL